METATTRRPWEMHSPSSHPQTQTLPSISSLTRHVDSRATDKGPLSGTMTTTPRDSGNWTGTSGLLVGTASQQTNTMPYLNSSTNHSPSQSNTRYSPDGPNGSQSGYSSAATSSHTAYNPDHTLRRGSVDFDDSRRGSVDSRIHQGMDSLRLGPTSPYNASANASQSSLVSNLQQQRGIQSNGYRDPRYSSSGPISPLWPRNGSGRGFGGAVAPRIAPPILSNPQRDIYNAAEPVRGQAYAFPDPDARPARPPSTFSRRGSTASSFTSTIYSTDVRNLPPGQQELPEHHHHTGLPTHSRVDDLKDDPDSPNSTTPYSRTPELRVTHKLAERKRRSEMKDCFEQLRAKLPTAQNNKSSKWETLARAIDYINQLESQVKQHRVDSDRQARQLHDMELQLKELSQRMGHQGNYGTAQSVVSTSPHGFGSHYGNGADGSNDVPRTLPPIMNGAMQGVQYSDERR